VTELIRAEAARFGLAVTHSEIVGLLPAEALIDAARFYLQLADLSPDQILENRLSEDR
jgi:glutamate formiminotransferase